MEWGQELAWLLEQELALGCRVLVSLQGCCRALEWQMNQIEVWLQGS